VCRCNTVRIVVPPSRVAIDVCIALVDFLVAYFHCPAAAVSVWAANEIECAMPKLGATLAVDCPDQDPLVPPRVELAGLIDGVGRTFIDNLGSESDPPGRACLFCSVGSYVRHGRRMYLLSHWA